MQKIIALAFSGLLAVGVAGCSTSQENGALTGGAAGALIGGLATGQLGGALVGGGIGAGAGYLIGSHPYRCQKYGRHGTYWGWCGG